jgi:hypothetical protein
MLSHSISTASITLLHLSPWTSPYLGLQLPSHHTVPLQLVACVDQCTPQGELWQITGHFTRRLGA